MQTLVTFLGWSGLINMIILLFWFVVFVYAHKFLYEFHTRWFKIETQKFDAIHYSAMAVYKLFIFFFNVIPYVILKYIM